MAEQLQRARARTLLMGVVNVTPDSFSDGGRYFDGAAALEHARRLLAEGADLIDVGGESTRPGAAAVDEAEEMRRVLPLIEALAAEGGARISIDTSKPAVAAAAVRAGATLINDVTGLAERAMVEVARGLGAGVVIMHMRGTPRTMAAETHYTDVVPEVKAFLRERARMARSAGIGEVIIDPGIGFAKTAAQSFELLGRLRELVELGYPVLIGPSRKSFLGTLAGMERVEDRLEGTLAAVVAGVLNGASIVRVHDVAACRKACLVADRVKGV